MSDRPSPPGRPRRRLLYARLRRCGRRSTSAASRVSIGAGFSIHVASFSSSIKTSVFAIARMDHNRNAAPRKFDCQLLTGSVLQRRIQYCEVRRLVFEPLERTFTCRKGASHRVASGFEIIRESHCDNSFVLRDEDDREACQVNSPRASTVSKRTTTGARRPGVIVEHAAPHRNPQQTMLRTRSCSGVCPDREISRTRRPCSGLPRIRVTSLREGRYRCGIAPTDQRRSCAGY